MATTKAYEIGQLGSKLTVDSDGDIALNSINGLVVDTSTLTVDPDNNRVGIGTTTPAERLDVSGNIKIQGTNKLKLNTNGSLFWTNSGNVQGIVLTNGSTEDINIKTSAAADIVFWTNGENERMAIKSDGKVGIGSATPNYTLDVYSSTSDWPIRGKSGDAKAGFIISDINTTNYIISHENKMSLGQSSDVDSSNVTILDNGRVGIGTTDPQSPLTVKSNSISSQASGIVVRANDGLNNIAAIGERSDGGGRFHLYDDFDNTIALYATSDKSFINTGGDFAVDSDTLYVDASADRIGIGTASPTDILHIANAGETNVKIQATSTGSARLYLQGTGGGGGFVAGLNSSLNIRTTASHDITFSPNATEAMRIVPAGNVGIGTNSISANGSKTTVHINNTTNGAAIRLSQGSSSSLIRYDTTNGLKVGTIAAETLTLQTNDTDRFEIDSAGLITVYNHIKPDTTLSYDLGDSDLRFRDIYLSGQTINMAGTKLTLDSAGDLEIKDIQNNYKRIRAKELEFDDEDADNTFKTVLKKDNNGRMSFVKVNRSTGVEVDSAEVLDLSANTTADLPEHTTAKFFTDARARSAVTKAHVDGLNVDADTLDGIQGGQYLRNGLYHNHSAATNPKYFKIGQIADNNGSFKVSGLIGGHDLGTTQGAGSVDLEIFSRYGTTHVQGRVSGQVGDNDVLVQRNADSDLEIWVKGVTYSLIDLQYNETSGATSYYNPSSTTTAPTGTNIWLASDNEATNNGETNILNELYVDGNRALTVADEGTGNGLDADTVDGLEASQFLRNDQDGTLTGNLAVTGDLTLEDSRVYFDTTAGQVVYASGGGGVLNLASDGYVHFIETDANPDSTRITADVNNTRFGIGVTPSQALDVSGNIKLTGRIYGPSTLYIDPSAHDSDTGTVVIAGNLQVDGTTTTINSTTVSINDKNLLLADSATTPSLADGAGLTFGDYDSAATLTFDASNDRLKTQKNVHLQGVGGSGSVTKISVYNDSDGGGHAGASAYLQSWGWGQARVQVGSNYMQQAGGKMQFSSNNQKVTWTSIGNFGINVGDPLDRLHVSGNIRIQNNNEIRTVDTGSTVRTVMRVNTSNELEYGWSGAGPVKIMGGGSYTERMRIHTDGNIGIGGETAPGARVEIKGAATTGTQLLWLSNSNGIEKIKFGLENTGAGQVQILDGSNNSNIYFSAHSADKSYINAGNVGIGTTNPASTLDVHGVITLSGDTEHQFTKKTTSAITSAVTDTTEVKGRQIDLYAYDDIWLRAGTGDNIGFVAGGSERMRILPGGNVGIGTNAPSTDVHILGATGNAQSTTVRIGGDNTNGNHIARLELTESATSGEHKYGFSFTADGNSSNNLLIRSHSNNTTGVTSLVVKRDTASVIVKGADDNSGKADFGVNAGGNPTVSLHGNYIYAGSSDLNYNARWSYSSSTATSDISVWSGNLQFSLFGSGDRDIFFKPLDNGTSVEVMRIKGANRSVGIGTNSPSEKLEVYGNIKHQGLTMTSGTDVDQLYSATLSWTPTTDWTDTGINYTDLSTGSYIVQVFIDDAGNGVGGYHYDEYYTGVMSWFAGGTNSTVTDEIPLHRAGHAPNAAEIFLRTQRHGTSDGNHLMLQIAGGYSHSTAVTVSFKFRRMI